VHFEIINHSQQKLPKSYLIDNLTYVLKQLKKQKIIKDSQFLEMTIVFLPSIQAKKMNQKFRNKNYATDVLSFSGQYPSLGEIVLCPEVLKRQAEVQGHSFREETLLMVIHGFLHLLGYDHEKNKREEKIMMTLQNDLFAKTLRNASK
jgi:probable rRNA maturation factor